MFWLTIIMIILVGGAAIYTLLVTRRVFEKKRVDELRMLDELDKDNPRYSAKKAQCAKKAQEFQKNAEYLAMGAVACSIVSVVLLIISILCHIFYSQNPGEASVIVSFTGEVAGVESEAGIHTMSPLDTRVVYDIRNNTLTYAGTNGSKDDYMGGDVSGPQITFQDANGVSGNVDVTVRYSIRGDSVKSLYTDYKTQEEFVHSVLAPSVRSQVRETFATYGTLDIYTNRNALQTTLAKSLSHAWGEYGVDLESVYLQEVRFPEEVVKAFASAQAAQTKVEQAKAEQEQAQVEAQTNAIKTSSLSQPVLMYKLIDAIKNGNGTYVVDTSNLSISVK